MFLIRAQCQVSTMGMSRIVHQSLMELIVPSHVILDIIHQVRVFLTHIHPPLFPSLMGSFSRHTQHKLRRPPPQFILEQTSPSSVASIGDVSTCHAGSFSPQQTCLDGTCSMNDNEIMNGAAGDCASVTSGSSCNVTCDRLTNTFAPCLLISLTLYCGVTPQWVHSCW